MGWNKGYTKHTHPSVLKISRTMRRKKIDNFARWRDEMKRLGKIKAIYPELKKNGDLAELIGVILGDGYLGKFPRSEVLRIVSNANNPGFIKRYAILTERVFKKKPYVSKRKKSNGVDITIYEKNISKRLKIPIGSKKDKKFAIPKWILKNKEYLIRYLRGLYEAEGSFCIHRATYTFKFLFANRNKSLLKNVYQALKTLRFNPHISKDKIQISRKNEV
ncbi:hypothetical protein KKG15_01640, partial [Patescibacteria group bacterium]|nr:hypothetical protein [Patescibacteria group bacterium]